MQTNRTIAHVLGVISTAILCLGSAQAQTKDVVVSTEADGKIVLQNGGQVTATISTGGVQIPGVSANATQQYVCATANGTLQSCAGGGQGSVGPAGPAGPSGAQGPAGKDGLTGATGATGLQGPVGATGAAGIPGPQGNPGTPGMQGTTGPAGPQGAKGDTGATGSWDNGAGLPRSWLIAETGTPTVTDSFVPATATATCPTGGIAMFASYKWEPIDSKLKVSNSVLNSSTASEDASSWSIKATPTVVLAQAGYAGLYRAKLIVTVNCLKVDPTK